MTTAADFRPAAFQASIFTPGAEFIAARPLTDLLGRWVGRFDFEPQLLPAGLPPEIPRAILQSRDGVWRAELAAARLNIHWRAPQAIELPADQLALVLPIILDCVAQYLDLAARPRVGRVAAVVNWICLDDAPAVYLARHFCQERWWRAPLNRPENFELHAHKHYRTPSGFDVNSWVRNKTAMIAPDGRPVIFVEQDLNTLEENAAVAAYDVAQIERFFGSAMEEFRGILALYYPTNATD